MMRTLNERERSAIGTAWTEKRKADREAMATQLATGLMQAGCAVTLDAEWSAYNPRCIRLHIIAANDVARCSIDFDGTSPQTDVYVVTWNLPLSDRHTSRLFDASMTHDRPHHKMSRVGYGYAHIYTQLIDDAWCFQDGEGFTP